jgi:hypothetical protein
MARLRGRVFALLTEHGTRAMTAATSFRKSDNILMIFGRAAA